VVSEGDTSYPRRESAPLPAYPDAGPGRRSRPPRPPLTKRMRRGHWIALDCVAGGLAAVAEMALVGQRPGIVAVPAVLLLGVAVFVPVALRRLAPVAAFGALIILAVLLAAEGFAPGVVFLAAAYVLYLVTATSNRRTSGAALGLALAVMVLIMLADHRVSRNSGAAGLLIPAAFALIVCWIAGYSMRQRRLYAQMLQEQATSSAVAEERLRIARELHDVVAHSMSVIAVQAGYGQYVIDSSPSDARDALGAIQATSRDALEEMRRMLGVLRQQDAAAAPAPAVTAPPAAPGTAPPAAAGLPAAPAREAAAAGAPGVPGAPGAPAAGRGATGMTAPLAPAPGLGRLGRLIERTNGAGVQVSLECSGEVRAVPAGVDLSAYRIIQEALTNVVKHAGGGARCVVSLDYGEEALHIRVTDDGGGSLVLSPARPGALGVPVGGTGHGIIGMRERANLCGGDFTAGALSGGGFEVNATLPLLGAAATSGAGAGGGTGGLP
jgi:signal transduction histidine kinase